MLKTLKFLLPILLIAIFVFFRLYKIDSSFMFFNDMGRDMMVLQESVSTKKPILLGPQTSALPFNQSAIYFYMLLPGYLLTQGNPISSIYTLIAVYITVFSIAFCLFKSDKNIIKVLLLSFFLASIHPQYIIQGRFVWNPSFVTPFIILALVSFYSLLQKYSHLKTFIFTFAISMSISLSYSVAPLLLALVIYWLIFNRQHLIPILVGLSTSLFFINILTVVFELRHNFLLTTALLTKKSPPQELLGLSDKFVHLSKYIFSTQNQILDMSLFVFFVLVCIYFGYKHFKKPTSIKFIVSFLFLLLTALTFILPVSPQAHYIFPLTSLIFIILSTFDAIPLTILLLVFMSQYLNPSQINQYFTPAARTYSQMNDCFKKYCQTNPSPTFVTVNSTFHPYHNGPEHRYLMAKTAVMLNQLKLKMIKPIAWPSF